MEFATKIALRLMALGAIGMWGGPGMASGAGLMLIAVACADLPFDLRRKPTNN